MGQANGRFRIPENRVHSEEPEDRRQSTHAVLPSHGSRLRNPGSSFAGSPVHSSDTAPRWRNGSSCQAWEQDSEFRTTLIPDAFLCPRLSASESQERQLFPY